jgi:FKBP-type peptidyl-prolyl cis-trans isomerase FkpA
MKTIKNLFLITLCAAVVVATGCKNASYKKTPGGMTYKVYEGKDTQKVRVGNFIKVQLEIKVNDSVVNTTGKLPAYLQVPPTPQPYDLSELWTKLSVGDSVVVTQMMDTFIKRNPINFPPQFKKGDRVMTYLKVLGVFTSDSLVRIDDEKGKSALKVAEIAEVEKYLADKKITAQKTPSGAYVQILNPGTGNLIDSGKYVTVNYT